MWVHVVIWYPVFWYFGLTNGKPVPDSDKSSSVTDTTVDRCDEDCSTKDGFAACKLHRISFEDAKAIINSSLPDHFWEVPEAPNKVYLRSPDDTKALEIYITSGRGGIDSLGYFLVKIDVDAESDTHGPYGEGHYFLLNVTGQTSDSARGNIKFEFKCHQIHHYAYKISMKVWAISRHKAKLNKKFAESASIYVSENYRKTRQMINACICESKVQVLRLYKEGDSIIRGYVQVTDFPRDGQLEILLLYNGTRELQTWRKNGTGNITHLRLLIKDAMPGVYNLKVKRHCPKEENKCGLRYPEDTVSKDLEIISLKTGIKIPKIYKSPNRKKRDKRMCVPFDS